MDSDGEWAPVPTLADLLPTKAALQTNVNGQELSIVEEKETNEEENEIKGGYFPLRRS